MLVGSYAEFIDGEIGLRALVMRRTVRDYNGGERRESAARVETAALGFRQQKELIVMA